MATTTSNLGLLKPVVGASADEWGDDLNASLDTLDAKVLDKTTGGTVAGALSVTGALSGNTVSGSGANLTNLNATNIATGTLANARTTATSANTANAIVARDVNGGFSAGTITASLNGSANQLNGQPGSFYQNADNLITGTIPNSRFPAILPAVSGANLTSLNANNITTGTVANARTTGTSANTQNALVLRDASGNFSAGTITATLSGSATSISSTGPATISAGGVEVARATTTKNFLLGGTVDPGGNNVFFIANGGIPNTPVNGVALFSSGGQLFAINAEGLVYQLTFPNTGPEGGGGGGGGG